MALIKQLVPSSKYNTKCPYAMTPKGICIHNTANDASAKSEVAYMTNNNYEVSFHVAIDDVEAIQCIPFNKNAWAAGDGGSGNGNRNYIHIEICYSLSGGTRFTNAEKRAAKEVAALLKQFGWGIDKVKKHQDFSGKYCPHRTLDMGWQRFLNMIQAELKTPTSNSSSSASSNSGEMYRIRKTWADVSSQKGAYSNLNSAKAECNKYSGYSVFNSKGVAVYTNVPKVTGTSYAEKGEFHFNTTVKIRTAPNLSSSTDTGITYIRGEKVTYHTVHLNKENYNWIQYTRGNGSQGYCAIKNLSTGEKFGVAY